ncbi:MAG: hypothetical protein AVDCRST_MAG07-763 [uncultured Frankineae bacterium]|uniref:Uncharacterized protein n=1 Tax=uncultured Frankineae bacterium TaxID=437475 RepID=A0A6J4KS29_9ACTN|nr:MAG: hypothetical protein AVDCRST_MAG07-763 [uncultured Frankineae bacterium]
MQDVPTRRAQQGGQHLHDRRRSPAIMQFVHTPHAQQVSNNCMIGAGPRRSCSSCTPRTLNRWATTA